MCSPAFYPISQVDLHIFIYIYIYIYIYISFYNTSPYEYCRLVELHLNVYDVVSSRLSVLDVCDVDLFYVSPFLCFIYILRMFNIIRSFSSFWLFSMISTYCFFLSDSLFLIVFIQCSWVSSTKQLFVVCSAVVLFKHVTCLLFCHLYICCVLLTHDPGFNIPTKFHGAPRSYHTVWGYI